MNVIVIVLNLLCDLHFDHFRMERMNEDIECQHQQNLKDRKELEEYIVYISSKRGSDGKILVKAPHNFESISNAMNREDLNSTTTNTWSQYLFQENFDDDLKAEFDGRYDGLADFAGDVKITKGLAQIQLLDRQLQNIAQKAQRSSTSVSVDFNEPDGRTFLTKNNDEHSEPVVSLVESKAAPKQQITTTENIRLKFENDRVDYILNSDDCDLFTAESDAFLGALADIRVQNERLDAELHQFGHLWRINGDEGVCSEEQASSNDTAVDYIKQMVRRRCEFCAVVLTLNRSASREKTTCTPFV